MTFATWSQTAASNTAVGGISTDGNVTLVNQIDNMFRGMMAELAVARDDGTIGATAPRGYLHGLTLSNNAGDATNDIDIAAGECVTSDSPYWRMALASALTKRLDAAWAVGTNQGGLDTGAIANSWYHVWLIQRSDTLVVDVLFSLSVSSPTMPASYDRKRRIGSVFRTGGALVLFEQFGDTYRWRTNRTVTSATSSYGPAVIGLDVPPGLNVQPIMLFSIVSSGVSATTILIGNGTLSGVTTFAASAQTAAGGLGSSKSLISSGFFTDTSARLWAQQTVTGAAPAASDWVCIGWIDPRGQV